MKTSRLACVGLAALLLAGGVSRGAETNASGIVIPPAAEILTTLKREHPRLLGSAQDFTRLKSQIRTNAPFKKWHEQMQTQAKRIISDPPSEYEIPDGLRLLSTSRRVLHRVQVLALLYRLENNKLYAQRAWRELETAAHFKDWNPRHFLDTAEMTHAFAIGYDWLYDAWQPSQRDTLRAAMVDKGLKPALGVYEGTARYGAWHKAHHNWNQVCNGGIGLGALALADVEPELAGKLLHAGLVSIQLAMAEFAPDGAWAEGPGYWNYATTYNIALLAALPTALGTDFGLAAMPGFAEAGMFPIYATGPFGRTFNYADASDGTIRAPHMLWMARHFERPVYTAYQRPLVYPQPLDLLWLDPRNDTNATLASLPLDKYFRRAEVVTLRGAWEDRDAVFAGFKGGDNKANHSNLDLGTFVLDALGVRWAGELGPDDYNLPGYFGGQRWNYYRLRAEGHNTLVLNPGAEPDQDPKAAARILRFDSKPQRAFAIADLTQAYAKNATNVSRGLALLNRRQVLIQDEVHAAKPADAWWFMHTSAQNKVSTDGDTAILTQGSARLWAHILSPSRAAFALLDAAPSPNSPHPEKQAINKHMRKLAIHLTDAKDVRLAVLFVPLREGEQAPSRLPDVVPLAQW